MTSLSVPSCERELAAVLEERTYLVEDQLFDVMTRLHDLTWEFTRGADPFEIIPTMKSIRSQFDYIYGEIVEAAKR